MQASRLRASNDIDSPAEWLTAAERTPPSVHRSARLDHAIDLFQRNPDARLMPVLDDDSRPIGALFEKDVRRLLLNPFGHALLRNPAYGSALGAYLKPVPIADIGLPVPALIDAYRSNDGSEGMILTAQGRLHATVSNRRLVHLAAMHERDRTQAQLDRAARIEGASTRFERQVASLSQALGELALTIRRNAAATGARSAATGDSAAAVAAATFQSADNLAGIEAECRSLGDSLDMIAVGTREAQALAAGAVALVAGGNARAADLGRSAKSIESVAQIIGDVARQVNLLALNASIEAARAGDAGRGFAVVANEVKLLSRQAALAADTVRGHIADIGGSIGAVIEGHLRIDGAIGAIAERSTRIMLAVDAQHAATRTITHHVGESVRAASATRSDVASIAATAGTASQAAGNMETLAERLVADAAALTAQAEAFLREIRVV